MWQVRKKANNINTKEFNLRNNTESQPNDTMHDATTPYLQLTGIAAVKIKKK